MGSVLCAADATAGWPLVALIRAPGQREKDDDREDAAANDDPGPHGLPSVGLIARVCSHSARLSMTDGVVQTLCA
jgi:hypothetical protein